MDIDNQHSQLGDQPSDGGNQSQSAFVPLQISPSGSLFVEHCADPRDVSDPSTPSPFPPATTLAPEIISAIKKYRNRMDDCIQNDFCYTEVAHASVLIEQCVLRLDAICEPLWEQCMLPLTQLQEDYQALEVDMFNGSINMSTQDGYANSCARLSVMRQCTCRLEFGLSSLCLNFGGLTRWINDSLTPVLVQLLVAVNNKNLPRDLECRTQMNALLHSRTYIFHSMANLTTNLKMYEKAFTKLVKGFDRILSPNPSQGPIFYTERQILRWARECSLGFKPIFDGLTAVASIPSELWDPPPHGLVIR